MGGGCYHLAHCLIQRTGNRLRPMAKTLYYRLPHRGGEIGNRSGFKKTCILLYLLFLLVILNISLVKSCKVQFGGVVELVYTQHSKCCAFGHVGSTPTTATT